MKNTEFKDAQSIQAEMFISPNNFMMGGKIKQ